MTISTEDFKQFLEYYKERTFYVVSIKNLNTKKHKEKFFDTREEMEYYISSFDSSNRNGNLILKRCDEKRYFVSSTEASKNKKGKKLVDSDFQLYSLDDMAKVSKGFKYSGNIDEFKGNNNFPKTVDGIFYANNTLYLVEFKGGDLDDDITKVHMENLRNFVEVEETIFRSACPERLKECPYADKENCPYLEKPKIKENSTIKKTMKINYEDFQKGKSNNIIFKEEIDKNEICPNRRGLYTKFCERRIRGNDFLSDEEKNEYLETHLDPIDTIRNYVEKIQAKTDDSIMLDLKTKPTESIYFVLPVLYKEYCRKNNLKTDLTNNQIYKEVRDFINYSNIKLFVVKDSQYFDAQRNIYTSRTDKAKLYYDRFINSGIINCFRIIYNTEYGPKFLVKEGFEDNHKPDGYDDMPDRDKVRANPVPA